MTPDESHQHRIAGAAPELDAVLTHEPVDGAAVYRLAQGESRVVLTHDQVPVAVAELQAAWTEEEERIA